MGVSYRNMNDDDLRQVQKLIPIVFADLFTKETGRPHYLPQRTKEEMTSYLEKDPDGAFVAVTERKKIIGCVFCHRWGDTGWLGPLVVLSSYQGRGIGSSLLKLATEHLVKAQCKVIGLETMPQTTANVGLYLRHGYFPENLRIRLGKEIGFEPESIDDRLIDCLDRSDVIPFLPEAARISRSVDPCIDYAREIEATYRFNLGRCLFWKNQSRISGFMLVHWIPASTRVMVKAMVGDPEQNALEHFHDFLSACEQVLAQEGMRQLIVPVYGGHHRVLEILTHSGYRVQHVGVRMLYRKDKSPVSVENLVHLAQWSG